MQAILLAAGFSTRMGELKQVMAFAGQPMVRQAAEPLLTAGLDLIVVIGHQGERVKNALYGLPCEYAINAHPEKGMFASVKCGCRFVESGMGCLITPCDCPGIRPKTVQRIQATLEQHPTRIVIPTFDGKRGHPTGLPAWLIEQIRALPNETPGLHSLWQHTPEHVLLVEMDDPAVIHDIDTAEDVHHLTSASSLPQVF